GGPPGAVRRGRSYWARRDSVVMRRVGIVVLGLFAAACTQSAVPQEQPSAVTASEIVVHATGDVLLDPSLIGMLGASRSAPWTAVSPLFRGDDVTIVNLECAPGVGGAPEDKEYTFRCADAGAQSAMRAAGVDVANMG